MDNKCIYEASKLCDNCGECRCDLNNNKICNNCGKCLEINGYDIRAIRIDEIMDTEEEGIAVSESLETENELMNLDNEDLKVDLEKNVQIMDEINKEDINKEDTIIDFIDDIPEISGIIEDEEKLKSMSQEIFPGLIKIHIKE